jgi:hypothetical protein
MVLLVVELWVSCCCEDVLWKKRLEWMSDGGEGRMEVNKLSGAAWIKPLRITKAGALTGDCEAAAIGLVRLSRALTGVIRPIQHSLAW